MSVTHTPGMIEVTGPELSAESHIAPVEAASFPATFQLPTSFDDLQAYLQLPSMISRYHHGGVLSYDVATGGGEYFTYSNHEPSALMAPGDGVLGSGHLADDAFRDPVHHPWVG
jgi:hypothetical protein